MENFWNNNRLINKLLDRGLDESTTAAFTFAARSSKISNLQDLAKSLEEYEIIDQINIDLKDKTLRVRFHEKDLAFHRENMNKLIGWLVGFCGDYYCELKGCGLEI